MADRRRGRERVARVGSEVLPGNHFVIGVAHDDDPRWRNRNLPVGACRIDHRQAVLVSHEPGHVGAADDMRQFALAIADIDRHHDCADPADRQPGQRQGGDIGQHDAYMRALGDAEGHQPCRKPVHGPPHFGIGDGFAGFKEVPEQGVASLVRGRVDQRADIGRQRFGLDPAPPLRIGGYRSRQNFLPLAHH